MEPQKVAMQNQQCGAKIRDNIDADFRQNFAAN
jgi:hypothetical protein